MSQLSISADAHARQNMLKEMLGRRSSTSCGDAATAHEPVVDLAHAMMRFGSTTVADWFDADEGF